MAPDVKMYFYRTRSRMEVDLLLETPGGVLAVEVKNRGQAYPEDARSLARLELTQLSDQLFKALAYYPKGAGLGAYASVDGIHWRMLVGNPVEEVAMKNSEVLFGKEIEHTVTWNQSSDLSHLAGRPVRLRVRLFDADLYSIRLPA